MFLPGKSHGQRSLVGYSPWSCEELTRLKWLSLHACKLYYRYLSPCLSLPTRGGLYHLWLHLLWWHRAWSMLHTLKYLLKTLSALVPIQWYHSNVRILPTVSLRLILAWVHLEHSGLGPQVSLLLLKAVSSQGLAVFPVWNLTGSLCLLKSNMVGGRTWVSVPSLPINPRIFYAK